MAGPISPSDIVAIAKFAWDLYQGCLSASSEFAAVGREAAGMRSILRMMKVFILDKKDSILNANTKEGKTLRKELEEQGGRCLVSLMDLDKLLKKYGAMTWLDKLSWATGGKDDVAEVQAQMASSCTQLNTFFAGVNTWGLGVVNENVKKNGVGLDAIEDALKRNHGNEKKSVKQIMGVVGRSASREDAILYKTIISEYAEEVAKSQQSERKGRSKTPDPVKKGGKLGVPDKEKRPHSEGPEKSSKVDKGADKKKVNKKPPDVTLECWLVKKGFSTERMEKQNRGQEQLKEMAEKFESSKRGLREGDDLVQWVLEDKNPDKDSRYAWCYLASRVEKVDAPVLGMGLREQIMIIIKRQMTLEAQKAADEEEKKEAARKAAVAKKAKEEKEKAEKLKKQKKEEEKKKKKEDEEEEAKKEEEDKDTKTPPSAKKPESQSNGKNGGKKEGGNDAHKKSRLKEHKGDDKKGGGNNHLNPDDDKKKGRRKSDASSISMASDMRRTKSDAGLGKTKDKPKGGGDHQKKDSQEKKKGWDAASTVSKKGNQGHQAKKAASETGSHKEDKHLSPAPHKNER